jgi:photosystem II stability/assembly factor-like uncharacterized protein
MTGRPSRRAVLCTAALAVAGLGVARAGVPRVLTTPALVSPKALGAAMLAVTSAGPRLVAVGERGTVLWSDDGGQRWQQARVPVQATLTTVRFVDVKTGWAAGHLGVILRSDDGGQSWTKQFDGLQAATALVEEARAGGDEAALQRARRYAEEGPDKPFFDLAFRDAQHGWAVGAYGLLFRTEDGGRSWRPATSRLANPMGVHLYAVQVSGQDVTIAGEQGFLARSQDGGEHFAPLASPYKGSFFGLLAPKDGSLIAFGLRGSVFRSTDGGAHWQKLAVGVSIGLSDGIELADGRVALLAQNGDLLLSRDGVAFERQAAARPLPAAGLVQAPSGELVLATLRGVQRQPLR